jgi:hypothetical protein
MYAAARLPPCPPRPEKTRPPARVLVQTVSKRLCPAPNALLSLGCVTAGMTGTQGFGQGKWYGCTNNTDSNQQEGMIMNRMYLFYIKICTIRNNASLLRILRNMHGS